MIFSSARFLKYTRDFVYFGCKQAYACIFGGALLFGIVATKLFWPDDMPISRYDALFCYALIIQSLLLAFRLETWEEAKIIFAFHVIGTLMEIFKTYAGSWIYPEENLIRIAGVPLFSGFMYSAVGSYLARVWKIFHFRFDNYPPLKWTVALCVLIYLNFFTHHYLPDIRYLLFAACFVLYWKTTIYFRPLRSVYHMPLLVGFFLVSIFIWLAENLGTFGAIWVYPSQSKAWHVVPLNKLGSWYLLMIISFVLVTILHKDKKADRSAEAEPVARVPNRAQSS